MCEYGFTEGADFNPLKIERVQNEGSREVERQLLDHQLTLDMAKELAMIQRTPKGKEVRQYFIEIEKKWNTPEAVMARALQMAARTLDAAKLENAALKEQVVALETQAQIDKPKAEYFDDLVERNLLTGIRAAAKELGIKQSDFVEYLLDKKYCYRDQKRKLQPYAPYVGDLFELKESKSDRNSWAGQQLMVTPRGRETFHLLLQKGRH